MSVTRSVPAFVVPVVLVAALLAGCDRAEAPPAPQTGDTPSTSGSVAAPPSSMPAPPSDTVPSPAPGGTSSSGDAAGTTQAHEKELTKQEESTQMPQSGQANNHSTANPVGEQK